MTRYGLPIAVGALILSLALALLMGLTGSGQAVVLSRIAEIEALLDSHYWIALVIYVAAFAVLISLTLPLATLFSITGGYLFGVAVGAGAALIAMTSGAMLTFVLVRATAGPVRVQRLQSKRSRAVFELLDANVFYYVALLRVVPIAPCFAVNAGAAVTGIDTTRFLIASLIGLTPSALIYASAGAGLNELVEAQEILTPRLLLAPEVGLPLLGVVVLLAASWMMRGPLSGRVSRPAGKEWHDKSKPRGRKS